MNLSIGQKAQAGFTLVEVLVAMTLFAIGILAVGGLQISSMRGNVLSSQINQGKYLAGAKLEELAAVADTAAVVSGSETGLDGSGMPGGNFDRTWVISALPAVSDNARRVEVQVSWSRGGQNHAMELETIIRGNTN